MRVLYYIIAVFSAAVLQTTLFHHLQVAGVKPLLLLAFAIIVSLKRGPAQSGAVGLVCGLIMDMFSTNSIGLNALLFMYLCVFSSIISENFFKDKWIVVALFVFFANLIYELIYFLLIFFIWGQEGFLTFFVEVILIECLYTTALSLPIFIINKRINRKLEEREGII